MPRGVGCSRRVSPWRTRSTASVPRSTLTSPAALTPCTWSKRGNRRALIQWLELDRPAAIVQIDLRREGEIEFSDRQGILSGIPPDGLVTSCAVGNPHLHVLLFGSHALERTLMDKIAREELRGRIC